MYLFLLSWNLLGELFQSLAYEMDLCSYIQNTEKPENEMGLIPWESKVDAVLILAVSYTVLNRFEDGIHELLMLSRKPITKQ